MRAADSKQDRMCSYVSPESQIPTNQTLCLIRGIIAEAPAQMNRKPESLYSQNGRLFRALLLQGLYKIRSERMLVEQLKYNILFRWFVDLSVDEPVWDHSTFSNNRDRLFGADIARDLSDWIMVQAHATGFLSDEYFSVDGTLIQAWALNRGYHATDGSNESPGGGGRSQERDFHNGTCGNETVASTTDPEANPSKGYNPISMRNLLAPDFR